MIGDVIEVQSDAGKAFKIEIAPMNQGPLRKVLRDAWHRARPDAKDDREGEGAARRQAVPGTLTRDTVTRDAGRARGRGRRELTAVEVEVEVEGPNNRYRYRM